MEGDLDKYHWTNEHQLGVFKAEDKHLNLGNRRKGAIGQQPVYHCFFVILKSRKLKSKFPLKFVRQFIW